MKSSSKDILGGRLDFLRAYRAVLSGQGVVGSNIVPSMP